MHKKLIMIASLASLLAACTLSFAGGGNILASGEIDLAATATPSTNTQTVSVFNITGKEWSHVYAIAVQNNSDFATTTTVKRIDLDDTTVLLTAVATSNATTYAGFTAYGSTANSIKVYSGTNDAAIYTNTVTTYYPVEAPCAKDLIVTVTMPTNDAAATLEYLIYGD